MTPHYDCLPEWHATFGPAPRRLDELTQQGRRCSSRTSSQRCMSRSSGSWAWKVMPAACIASRMCSIRARSGCPGLPGPAGDAVHARQRAPVAVLVELADSDLTDRQRGVGLAVDDFERLGALGRAQCLGWCLPLGLRDGCRPGRLRSAVAVVGGPRSPRQHARGPHRHPDGVAGVGVRGDLWCRPRCAISGSSVNNSSMPGVSALATLMVNRLLDSVLCVDVGLWLL